ncbi:MAG: hypothetical protein Q9219_002707 [cf. Caloplaca sp. 3 TL-2023]
MLPLQDHSNSAPTFSARIAKCAEELKALSDQVGQDEAARKQLHRVCQQTSTYLEKPTDVIWQYINTVPIISVLKAAILMGLVDALNATEQPLTAAELAPAAAPMAKLGDYIAEHGSKGLDSSTEGVWQYAHGSSLPLFGWLQERPSDQKIFNTFMSGQRNNRPDWFDIYPVESHLLSHASTDDPSSPLLVDIAGGIGADLTSFSTRFPSAPGALVLQDLPSTIAHNAPSLPSTITPMPHDMFTPQPVVGARAYYFRAIFHDWPDEKCVEILRHTRDAMRKGYSRLLVHEWVLSDTGAALQGVVVDVVMMALLGGKERTETAWREVLGKAGLRVEKVWRGSGDSEALIEAVRDDE